MSETRYKTLAQVTEADYQWHSYAILQRESDGKLFVSSDAGCSCNYPEWDEVNFSTYTGIDDVEPLDADAFQDLVKGTTGADWMKDEVADFLTRVRQIMNEHGL